MAQHHTMDHSSHMGHMAETGLMPQANHIGMHIHMNGTHFNLVNTTDDMSSMSELDHSVLREPASHAGHHSGMDMGGHGAHAMGGHEAMSGHSGMSGHEGMSGNEGMSEHEAMNGHMGHMMSMTFHGGYVETILFSWWNVTGIGAFISSFIAIFFIALIYEGLKYYRKHLLYKTYSGLQYCAVSGPDKGVNNICAPDEPQVIQPVAHVIEHHTPTMLSRAHAWQTLLHGIQVLVSYMLMLVFMTYNTWLCAAVVLGSACGYFLFGWRESVVVDFTEHCH